MVLKDYLENKHLCLFKNNNRYSAKLSYYKATTTFVRDSPIMKDISDSFNKSKQATQKVMESSLYSRFGLFTTNSFSNSIYEHPGYLNNIKKEILVESFVGSSTCISVS